MWINGWALRARAECSPRDYPRRPSKPMKILFVCHANVGRSQVAQVYFDKLSRHTSDSAGIAVDELIARLNLRGRTSPTRQLSIYASVSGMNSEWT